MYWNIIDFNKCLLNDSVKVFFGLTTQVVGLWNKGFKHVVNQIKKRPNTIPLHTAKIKNNDNIKSWQGWRETESLKCCWWECKIVQSLWKCLLNDASLLIASREMKREVIILSRKTRRCFTDVRFDVDFTRWVVYWVKNQWYVPGERRVFSKAHKCENAWHVSGTEQINVGRWQCACVCVSLSWTQELIWEKVGKVGDILGSSLGSRSSLVLLFLLPRGASLLLFHGEHCSGFFITWDLTKHWMPFNSLFSLFCFAQHFSPSCLSFPLKPCLYRTILVLCKEGCA